MHGAFQLRCHAPAGYVPGTKWVHWATTAPGSHYKDNRVEVFAHMQKAKGGLLII